MNRSPQFPHHSNVRRDLSMMKLIAKFGIEGYGVFWSLVEDLHGNGNSYPLDYELIAFYLDVEEPTIKSIIHDFGFFTIKNGCFSYERIGKPYLPKLHVVQSRPRMYVTDVKKWYKMLKIVFERDKYTCQYCGVIGGKLEGDHVIPFSKGGEDSVDNLTTACQTCNRQKRDKTVSEFMEWRKSKIEVNSYEVLPA